MEEFDKSSLYYVDSTPEGTRYSLYDTASWKNGLAFKNIDFSETGLPVIKIAELNNGISSSTAYTDKTYSQDVFLTKGDYVFSWSGNPETSIDIYKYNLPDGWLNQHIFKVTPKTEIIDKGFFFYLMKFLKPYFKEIATNKQTTGLGHVTISDLQRMSVTLPSLPTQQKIAAILSSLDDKIELNNKINTNLEQQAGALFKNWFVDFEPFGGKMPEGWKEVSLNDVCSKITDGSHYSPKDDEQAVIPMLSVKDMERYGFNTKDCKHISEEEFNKMLKNDCVPQVDDILVAKDGSYLKEIFICNKFEKLAILSSIAIFRPNKKNIYPELLLTLLKSPRVLKEVRDNYVSGSALPRIVLKDFKKLKFYIPNISEQKKITDILKGIRFQIECNVLENRNLSSLRDTLLPKLMNGEVEV